MRTLFTIFITALFAFVACTGGSTKQAPKKDVAEQGITIPSFNGDSAYKFVEKQVSFGPRVPNSDAHKACAEWLADKLRSYGAEVTMQRVQLTAYTGTKLDACNIIASFQPQKRKRILLCAHWDSRPWADADPDPANHRKPILGANDGGSGVGVLIEVARLLSLTPSELGIDIVLFDAEDYGTHASEMATTENSWALGSQYWARMPHKENYNARFGILLDIVGAPQSKFLREGISEHYASSIVDKVWKRAAEMGFSSIFINEEGGYVTDDHLYVNEFMGIPCIDIINRDKDSKSGFGPYWHTVKDDMSWISAETLRIVGQTVVAVIYNEK
ncbi:MAG: M28 family peptidase [Bacteroidaceae bacterium]|nr:M28 family peptidase [Bacteroidaceae bacterium]